jgi:uncharacterized repeat protein (TIGR01451 family)
VLPPGLPYVSHEECNCTTFNPLTGEWLIGDLANGSSVYLTLITEVTQRGNLTNNATKTAANEYDTNTTNDQDNATVNGQPAADIVVVKIVDNTNPNVGERITFTIEVTNNGPNNATGLEITDGLPAGLTYESNTTSQGTYNAATDVWSLGNLDVGAVATLNITAIVTQPGFRTNTVELLAADQFDPDSTPNNQDPTEDDQDDTLILSTPISVPALTPTGLIALVGLLSAITAMSITIKRGKRR